MIYRTLLAASLLALSPTAFAAPPAASASTPPTSSPAGPRRFHIDQFYEVKALPAGAKEAQLFVPIPEDDPSQAVTGLVVDASNVAALEVHDPAHGNSARRFAVPPKGLTVHVGFDVERRENAADLSRATGKPAPNGYARWLTDDALVGVDDRIRKIAAEVTAKATTPREKARAIYDYTLSTMKYQKTGEGWGKGSIVWACDMKYGNCTDFHALLIGLLRASGIPARFQIGYSVPDLAHVKTGDIPGYHCWAYFYLDGAGWVPVDASEGWKNPEKRDYYFGHHDRNRFALSLGRDIALPGMKGTPLNYFVYPYLEIDGLAGTVSRKTTYSELP